MWFSAARFPRSVPWALAVLTLGACVQTGPDYGTQSGAGTMRRSTSASGSTSGSSTGSSTGATSGGATTGTGASTGSSGSASATTGGPQDCPLSGTELSLTDCDGGYIEIITNLVQYAKHGNPPPQSPVVVMDINNGAATATSDSCGYVRVCAPSGSDVSMSLNVTGYEPLVFATVQANTSTQIPNSPGLPLLPQDTVATLLLSAALPYNPDLAVVLASIYPHDFDGGWGAAPSGPCSNKAGWVISLEQLDGGLVDSNVCYTDLVTCLATGYTASNGFVLFYNIDPAVGQVQITAYQDAGIDCENPEEALPWELTGSVYLLNGYISYVPYIVAAP